MRSHYNREEYWKDKPKKRQTKKQKNCKARKIYGKNRQKLLSLIGNKCAICGSTKRLIFHEIHGKNHLTNGTSAFIYYFEHYKDFITLCYFHHKFLHQFAECRNWELFQLLVSAMDGLLLSGGRDEFEGTIWTREEKHLLVPFAPISIYVNQLYKSYGINSMFIYSACHIVYCIVQDVQDVQFNKQ